MAAIIANYEKSPQGDSHGKLSVLSLGQRCVKDPTCDQLVPFASIPQIVLYINSGLFGRFKLKLLLLNSTFLPIVYPLFYGACISGASKPFKHAPGASVPDPGFFASARPLKLQ